MDEPKQILPSSDEDDSFVILGSSPTNLYSHINFLNPESIINVSITNTLESGINIASQSNLEEDDKNKILSNPPSLEESLEFKAHFKLGDEGSKQMLSESSMVIANSVINENLNIDSMHPSLAKLLDENISLKETTKVKHDYWTNYVKTIASWQDDMSKTHKLTMRKYDETKQIIIKLRKENNQLRTELNTLRDLQSSKLEPKPLNFDSQLEKKVNGEGNSKNNSPNTSVYEFIVKRDEDTIDKLTAQLELVEKQRRQVIAENEKLQWQIESMDGTITQITKDKNNMEVDLQKLKEKLSEAEQTPRIDETVLRKVEDKNAKLVSELKAAQLKILELENAKLNHSIQKNDANDHIKQLKSNIQELQARLRDAHTVVFQPMRYSLSLESCSDKEEFGDFKADVKLYDQTLKHLSDFLNLNSHSVCEVCEAVNACLIAVNTKSKSENPDELMENLSNLKLIAQSQQNKLLEHTSQIKATLTIFEKIFQNYQDVLKLLKIERKEKVGLSERQVSENKLLSSAEAEVTLLRGIVASLKDQADEKEAFRAQLEIYKADFEAERKARLDMASLKESGDTELKLLQRRHHILQEELARLHNKYPETMSSSYGVAGVSTVPKSKYTATPSNHVESKERRQQSPPLHSSHVCPICEVEFKTLKLLTDHVNSCVNTLD